jgi:zinc protease
VEKTVEKGIEPRSRVRLVFTGPFRWSPAERVVMKALQMILEGQLGAALREEQSGTYGVKVTAEYQRVPQPEYEIEVDFNCAPERTEGLVKSLFSEIDRLRMDGPAEAHVRDIRAALLREYETASKENQFLVEEIAQRYEDGEDVRDVARIPALYDGLSAESVRDAARLYLDTRNYVRVTLVPEKTK